MVFSADMEMVIKLLLASLFGGIIGLEREVHGRPAGFRTHLLVSLGSCLFVVTSIEFYKIFGNFSGNGPVGVDPGRVAAQVVTGIGFLGAGAILREKASIRGLTTAACLWVASAIGIACGIGLFGIALVVTTIALVSLMLLKRVEKMITKDIYVSVKIWSNYREGLMPEIEKVLESCQLQIIDSRFEKNIEQQQMFFEYDVRFTSRNMACNVIDSIATVAGVRKVRVA